MKGMLPGFHPLVSGWFETRFGSPTEPQAAGWPEIQAGRDVLVSAPTGSGKTFAAFLSGLDSLFREGLDGDSGRDAAKKAGAQVAAEDAHRDHGERIAGQQAEQRPRDADGRTFGMLSRGVCGTLGEALVCNLPGSSGGAVECLEAVLDAVPHILDLLAGGRPH